VEASLGKGGGSARPSRQDRPQRLGNRLAQRILGRFPEEAFGLDGRLRDWRDGLVRGVDPDLVPDDPKLKERLRLPLSGAALAVNSFAPWQATPGELELLGLNRFDELRFHIRCPTGVRGTPPRLELLARAGRRLVGVVALGFDYLAQPRTRLSAAYWRRAERGAAEPWLALLRELDEGARLRHVDLAALARLALGLAHSFPDRPGTLVYLYLEPAGDPLPSPFQRHRDELALLARRFARTPIAFRYGSFSSLWRSWRQRRRPVWASPLAAALADRYEVGGHADDPKASDLEA